MHWRGKQTPGALFKREECFAAITLAQSKKNFVQLYGSRSQNFPILKRQEFGVEGK